MARTYTPLMLQAMNGLLNNSSVGINTELAAAIAAYQTQTFLSTFNTMVAAAQAAQVGNIPDPTDPEAEISDATITSLIQMCSAYSPLTNIEPGYVQQPCSSDTGPCPGDQTGTLLYTDVLLAHITAQLGFGDHSKFISHFQSVSGYVDLINDVLNAAVNGPDVSASTFTTNNDLITANISLANIDVINFGIDLVNTGKLIDLTDLDNYGTPHALAGALVRAGMLGTLRDEFDAVGISTRELETAVNSAVTSGLSLLLPVQRIIYDIAAEVTGSKLTDIMLVLGMKTKGITTLADLIDSKKIFPISYDTLSFVDNGVKTLVYGANDISPATGNLSTVYISVMPGDIAKANLAVQTGLYQISDINTSETSVLGEVSQQLELTTGLPNVSAATSAMSASAISGLQGILGNGTNYNGTYYLSDALGSAAGIPHRDIFIRWNAIFVEIASPEFNELTNIINRTAGGDSAGIIEVLGTETWPFDGYADMEAALVDLIAEFDVALIALAAKFPSQLAEMLSTKVQSQAQISRELSLFAASSVIPTLTQSSATSPISFAARLHALGNKTSKQDAVEILEKVSNTSIGGEAIIATMREGRNLDVMARARIRTNTKSESDPKIVDPGDILPGNP